jgi:nitroreductase
MTDISTLLAARYGHDHVPAALLAVNPTLETLLKHKSIRDYLTEPLPEGAVELLVAAAQSAASSSNLQLWSVVAVTDAERKQRLAELANHQTHIAQAPLFLVWLADVSRLAHILEQENLSPQALYEFDLFLMAVLDAGLAAQNAVIAAEAQGWGTVYIGALRQQVAKVAAELQLPKGVFPVFGLCVGLAKTDPGTAIKPRLPQTAILHQETYQSVYPAQAVADYDETMLAFYKQQNMNVSTNWTAHCSERIQQRQKQQLLSLYQNLKELGFNVSL